MQAALTIVVPIVLLSSVLASYHSNSKLRRDGVHLHPFPRVGRVPRNTMQVPLNDYVLEYEPVEKRQLYAFPRVGRNDPSLMQEPLQREFQPVFRRAEASEGMWFGPRLGRAIRSEDYDNKNENNDRSEPEQVESVDVRKKRQAHLM